MAIDVQGLTEQELVSAMSAIREKMRALEEERRQDAIKQIRVLMIDNKLSPKDISKGWVGKIKRPDVKYSDGVNKWTGRGHKPKWLVAALASGKTIDQFRVA